MTCCDDPYRFLCDNWFGALLRNGAHATQVQCWLWRLMLLTSMCLPCTASWAQNADIDLHPGSKAPLWAGAQITLNLDIKTDGLSFGEVFFDLPQVSGAYLLRTDSNTVKLSEKRGGETWQVLRYPLSLFVPQGGTVFVPAFEVRFKTSAGFGTQSVAHELTTAPLDVTVLQPPGVSPQDMVITTPQLEIDYDWSLPTDPVTPGDALTLSVRRRSAKVSAMLLPPLPVYTTSGLADYPATPELEDRSNRGALVGERTDRVTWIIEQAGRYEIPAIRFSWWDPQRERLRDQVIEGVTFEVIADPTASIQQDPRRTAAPLLSLQTVLFAGLLMTAMGLLIFWQRARLAQTWRRILPPPRRLQKRLNRSDS